MDITVNELLKNAFLNRSREEKERIVLKGRPRPFLQNLRSFDTLPSCSSEDGVNNGEDKKCLIFFDVTSYDHVEWMTGCELRQALFCWPCLLYRVQKDLWNTTGFTQLSQLKENIKIHERSVAHIQAMLDLYLFSNQIKTDKPSTSLRSHDNELINRNREIVRRIIDVVCFLAMQQQPPRSGTTDKNKLQIEDCLENLQFLRDYDILQANLIDDATDMLQISPNLVTDVLDAIGSVIKTRIQRETSQSSYVSLILSEHSKDPLKSQISTVLRYLKDGEVCERFVGFTNSEAQKSAVHVFNHVNNVITEFQISRRIIAYSLDGSVLHLKAAMDELKKDLKFRYPYAYFVPCHFHKLDYILQQNLSFMQDCEYFFKHLTAISSFFHEESGMLRDVRHFSHGEIPSIDFSKSTNHAEFFYSLGYFRRCLTDFFNYTINNPDNVTSDNLLKMVGLRAFMTDMKTIFLIDAFSILFEIVSPLNEALKSENPYKAFRTDLFDGVLQALQHEFDSGEFDNLWKKTVVEYESIVKSYPNAQILANRNKQWKRISFHKLYQDIVRCMISQVTFRLENLKTLEFFSAFNDKESRKTMSPESLQSVVSAFGKCFNVTQLNKEIQLLNQHELGQNTETVHQLLKFFKTAGTGRSFENLLKLSEISLTMPCTSPPVENYSSKLKEINVWSYSFGKHEISGDMSLLCIERDYLKELRKKITFYDEVVLQVFQTSHASSPSSPAYAASESGEEHNSPSPSSSVMLSAPQSTSTTELNVSRVSQQFEPAVHCSQSEKFPDCQNTVSRITSWIHDTITEAFPAVTVQKSPDIDSCGEGKDDDKPKKKRKKEERIDNDVTHKFWCQSCSKGFFSAYNLRRHCRNVHKMLVTKGSSYVQKFESSN